MTLNCEKVGWVEARNPTKDFICLMMIRYNNFLKIHLWLETNRRLK